MYFQISDFRPCFNLRCTLLTLFFWVGGIGFCMAQQGGKVAFNASTSKKEVVAGGSVEVSFKLIGVVGGTLSPPSFEPFKPNGGVSESSGIQFINGDTYGQHTWTYALTAPSTAGQYTIGPATVVHNGKTYTSNPVSVKVIVAGTHLPKGITKLPSGADPNIFIAAELSALSAFVGQQVVVTLNLYTAVTLTGMDIIQTPNANTGTMKPLDKYDNGVSSETIQGRSYLKQTLSDFSYIADAPGPVAFSAGSINVGVRTRNLLSPVKVLTLSSDPLILEVKSLPLPAPKGFCGMVGSYQASWESESDSIGVGDAAVVQLEIRGNGDPKAFLPPAIQYPENIQTFDPAVKSADEFENGQELVHTQTLEYTFSAKQQGQFNIVPNLVWFDPDSNKYITSPIPFTLKVGPARKGAAQPAFTDGKTGLPGFWSTQMGLGTLALLAAALLGAVYYFWFGRNKGNPETTHPKPPTVDPEAVTQPNPPAPGIPKEQPSAHEPPAALYAPAPATRSNLYTVLAQYLDDDADTAVFYQTLLDTLKGHFSRTLGIPLAQVDQHTVVERLIERGNPLNQVNELAWLWRICEEALFAAQPHHGQKSRALQIAEQWLT